MFKFIEFRWEPPKWLSSHLKVGTWLWKSFTLNIWSDPYCAECEGGISFFDMYMVHDDIWGTVCAEKDYLHLECLEKRLGRDLTPTDFTEYPVNKGLLYFYKKKKRKYTT